MYIYMYIYIYIYKYIYIYMMYIYIHIHNLHIYVHIIYTYVYTGYHCIDLKLSSVSQILSPLSPNPKKLNHHLSHFRFPRSHRRHSADDGLVVHST